MLWSYFLTNSNLLAHKWAHYFPIYERHFNKFVNQSVVFWEIGVSRGGSLRLWKQYLGPLALIVGLDINPVCRDLGDQQIQIRLGDQADPVFLQGVIDEFGPPDAVLDDGSHKMDDIRASFDYLYPRLNNNGVYMVEDLHTCYWQEYGGGLKHKDSFIEHCQDLLDELNAYHLRERVGPPDYFTRNTHSVCFYDSMAVFEKMKRFQRPYALKTGS